MQQSAQPCDRVKPRTNFPSTACSSKCLASQEIVPLTTNVLPQKHYRGVRGPPTPLVTMMVMFFPLRSDCPLLRSQKGADRTWHTHVRVQPGAPSAPTNQGREQHLQLTCALQTAHDFSKKKKRASKTHSTKQSLPIKRAPPLVIISLRTKPSDCTRISACYWQIRVRPDALLHLRKHFHLEDIGFRSDSATLT